MEKVVELELELDSTMEYIDFSSLAVDTGYGRTMPFMAEVVVSLFMCIFKICMNTGQMTYVQFYGIVHRKVCEYLHEPSQSVRDVHEVLYTKPHEQHTYVRMYVNVLEAS